MKIYILIVFLFATIRAITRVPKVYNEDIDGLNTFASILMALTTVVAYVYLCLEFITLK